MSRTEEIEIQREELLTRGKLLNVRVVFNYKIDEDGVNYSHIDSGQAWSSRRNKWVDMSRYLIDTIYNANFQNFEDEAFDRHDVSYLEEKLMIRDYYKDLLSRSDMELLRGSR